jgi:hypothetical protein
MSDSIADLAISDALDMYSDLGYDPIPLQRGTKKPLGRGWQNRPIYRLWADAPDDINIGLRGGGLAQAAFIDCDEKSQVGTFDTAERWLAGLGYPPGDYPVVSTASGNGRHIYVSFVEELPGSVRRLDAGFGSGEFRYGSGGHVAAPPSRIVGGMNYRLLDGDLRQLPRLGLNDVLPILGNQAVVPAPVLRMSRKAQALLHGNGIERYKSRSEADAMLVASLINSGYPVEAVLELFESHPTSGKYHELKATKGNKVALHYLRETYTEVFHWTQAHESKARRIAKAAIDWALSRPWPGRTGAVDRNVFVAHMKLASRAGKLIWAASSRDLAVLAGVNSNGTAARASHRLCSSGFIALQSAAIGTCASIFRLNLVLDNVEHSPSTPSVRECATLPPSHDAFRYGGLGKSAEHIFQTLQEMPRTMDETAERTGRSRRTVKRWLERMRNFVDPLTGEYLPMVTCDDSNRWHALPVDLDQVARVVGTSHRGERQRAQYAEERQAHWRALLRGQRNSALGAPERGTEGAVAQ